MNTRPIVLHLVSEATGQTLEAVVRACGAQFRESSFLQRNWNLVRSQIQVGRVLAGIAAEPGPVLSSLTTPSLRDALRAGCRGMGVQVENILDSTIYFLERETGTRAERHPGGQYVMDDEYRRRIDAMQYVVGHDDGQRVKSLEDADVVLVGVSRTSKTPTCFYLANRGIRAANVPLVQGVPLPEGLLEYRGTVVGLMIDPHTLVEIRRSRVGMMLPGRKFARRRVSDESMRPYVDPTRVQEELVWARRLCAQHGWPVINVTHRSVEETAAAIIDMMSHPPLRRMGHPMDAGNMRAGPEKP
ncbi:kinase/pyrophosphorylase [Gluconacetobacter entanii]|uniref:Putative pyruvate, phosphate dikinase regulatory protein n=1 Tax=Gluconacetobacter entanii TaxID=108528 RepID=A0ABT3K796_9PROT|nr:pyruvate, water dikinase regulatory protein [Gluconacetobacter entanii]MCW4591286.1 kinase/pyrophosphorylase [Gluconacetobacter entanii]MCW4595528.1 kinase/pyrophosphorylase [Gluconacetobacter entanii]NPC90690.1 kinase/pyrophosphorylase [Gluconacetobacter entanii]